MTKRKPTKHQDDIRRNLRKNVEINDIQSPHDGIHTCSKGCSKPGCNRGLRDTIEEQDAQIQALAVALKEKARATVHDLNLIASLKEDNESLTGQVRQFEEHRDIAAGLIAGLEKDKAAADRATFDAIRTITELRAEFEAFMTNPTSRLLRAERKENARLKAEVERLRASSFVTAVPSEDYEKLKAENERLRKAGDAMLNAIKVSDPALDWKIELWKDAKERTTDLRKSAENKPPQSPQ